MKSGARMRDFWDERAREDAYFFVDNRLVYGRPDEERFWAAGVSDLEVLMGAVEARLDSDDEVLEIGCGLGRLTRALAERARSVIALDVSAEMLARAQDLNPALDNVRWIQGDGTSLAGVEDAAVDASVSHVVFQHIPDPQITLGYVREMGRVLRPGGWAAFQVSNDPAVHRRRPLLRDRVRALVGRAPRGQTDPAWRGSAVDLADLRSAAATGGLEVERTAYEGTQYCVVMVRRTG
jgi:SAM-dependent methyltransferase